MANPPFGAPDPTEDDESDLGALDVSATAAEDDTDGAEDETDLGEILGEYVYSAAHHADSTGADFDPPVGSGAEDAAGPADMPTFTVTNPPGTVTVTTYMDGRVEHVDLSPGAAEMTETVLADEIVVIAGLATQDARSAQYTLMLEGMRQQGHDNVATRDFLSRDLDLPTPEQARAARAELFANRYTGEE